VSAVSVVLNFIGGGKKVPLVISIILMVATFVWSIVVMKLSLAAADGKEDLFSWKSIQALLPDWRQVVGVIGVGILAGLLTLAGLILLIIPGIWVAFRLSVANLAYLDKGEGVRKSLRASWNMTKGPAFWTAVLVCITAGLLYIVGFVLFGVGILVTYPLAMILMAKFYRALTVHHAGLVPAVQPAEIVAPAQ
ncbi:MAG: hypothetical protein AAB681_01820, partial [Patescibacteria group bacterium]